MITPSGNPPIPERRTPVPGEPQPEDIPVPPVEEEDGDDGDDEDEEAVPDDEV
jgi:hypothetical protein